jgi:hypothetical protein
MEAVKQSLQVLEKDLQMLEKEKDILGEFVKYVKKNGAAWEGAHTVAGFVEKRLDGVERKKKEITTICKKLRKLDQPGLAEPQKAVKKPAPGKNGTENG